MEKNQKRKVQDEKLAAAIFWEMASDNKLTPEVSAWVYSILKGKK